jgi:heme O synthase-like polyprenyltransferase
MSSKNNEINKQIESEQPKKSNLSYSGIIYGIIRFFLTIIAIYLSYTCNDKSPKPSLLIAFCCSEFYIFYIIMIYMIHGTCKEKK